MNRITSAHGQRGAATLLTAMVLMTSITVITLAVARTQLVEQRILNNDSWMTRLTLEADTGIAEAIDYTNKRFDSISWSVSTGAKKQHHAIKVPQKNSGIKKTLTLYRSTGQDSFIQIVSGAQRNDGSGLNAVTRQQIRPLSVLTPFAENAPPLVLNGCLNGIPKSLHLWPENADTGLAGSAMLGQPNNACAPWANHDFHKGRIDQQKLPADLWPVVFSVDRTRFKALSDRQRHLPLKQRRYWQVKKSDMLSGRWSRSVGTAQSPVAIYFPPTIGCPRLSPGLLLHAVIFIDSVCRKPLATQNTIVYGAVIANGSIDITNSELQLKHISNASAQISRLRFPVLRSVVIPGTWRDF